MLYEVITHANDNFLNALGYRLEEVVGKHHRIFCNKIYITTNDYTQFWEQLGKGISQINEFERIRKDGSSIVITSYSIHYTKLYELK